MNRLQIVVRALLGLGLVLATGAYAQQAQQPAKAGQPAAAKPAKAKGAAPPAYKLELEPRAMDLLRAMSGKLAAARSLSFTATSPERYGP